MKISYLTLWSLKTVPCLFRHDPLQNKVNECVVNYMIVSVPVMIVGREGEGEGKRERESIRYAFSISTSTLRWYIVRFTATPTQTKIVFTCQLFGFRQSGNYVIPTVPNWIATFVFWHLQNRTDSGAQANRFSNPFRLLICMTAGPLEHAEVEDEGISRDY